MVFVVHIQIAIDEDQFRAESKKLAIHLADPEVEVKFRQLVKSIVEK